MSLNEMIMRLIRYAKAEILPVIPESDKRMVTAIGITNALIQEGEAASESFIPPFSGELILP